MAGNLHQLATFQHNNQSVLELPEWETETARGPNADMPTHHPQTSHIYLTCEHVNGLYGTAENLSLSRCFEIERVKQCKPQENGLNEEGCSMAAGWV